MASEHGTRTRYNSGCHCLSCKKADTDYQRNRRRSRKSAGAATGTLAAVTVMPERPSPAAVKVVPERPSAAPAVFGGTPRGGLVEDGVAAEIGGLSTADSRPGLVQAAYALARVLDNIDAYPQHSAAAHRLSEVLEKLRKGSDAGSGRLASVRQMTRPTTGVAG